MKTFTSFLTMVFSLVFFAKAQDINIDFAAQGAASTVDQVVATNLSTEESVTLQGDKTLVLHSLATAIASLVLDNSHKVAPNPYNSVTHLLLPLEEQQKVSLSLTDLSGAVLIRYEKVLDRGSHRFQMAANNSGIYLVSVETAKGITCSKIVQTHSSTNQIDYIGGSSHIANNLKSSTAEYVLNYSPGDIISYAMTTGAYTTIVNESPSASASITATMVECKDGDGNDYPVVKIGEQIWMAKDMKTTKYADGTSIPNVTNQTAWYNLGNNLTDKAYCIYNNNANGEKDIYGALYTYAAAVNGTPQSGTAIVQGVCPTGWHVPSVAECNILSNYLGGSSVAGGKLKETGTAHWTSNTGASNISGFYALPNGYREDDYYEKSYMELGMYGRWWTSVKINSSYSQICYLEFNSTILNTSPGYYMSNGIAVRCIKD